MGKIDASAFLQQQQQGSAEQDTDSQRQNIKVGKLGEFELLILHILRSQKLWERQGIEPMCKCYD